jgi:DNA-binding NarL/FixJ family response regulator
MSQFLTTFKGWQRGAWRRVLGRFEQEIVEIARLTSDDIVLLTHERRGHSSKAIAAALSTSEQAVNSRFQRMNARLGVPNRRAAAQLAAEFGLI